MVFLRLRGQPVSSIAGDHTPCLTLSLHLSTAAPASSSATIGGRRRPLPFLIYPIHGVTKIKMLLKKKEKRVRIKRRSIAPRRAKAAAAADSRARDVPPRPACVLTGCPGRPPPPPHPPAPAAIKKGRKGHRILLAPGASLQTRPAGCLSARAPTQSSPPSSRSPPPHPISHSSASRPPSRPPLTTHATRAACSR